MDKIPIRKRARHSYLRLTVRAIARMSRAAKGLIAVIIVVTLVGLVLAAFESSPIGVAFIAGVGGLLVFLGLLIEKNAEREERKCRTKITKAIRLVKLKSELGWWILMLGIFVEIVDAGWTAADSWITKQLMIRNGVRNQPIASASATLVLTVRGTNLLHVSSVADRSVFGIANIEFGEYENWTNSARIELIADNFDKFIGDATSDYYFNFHAPVNGLFNAHGARVSAADKWDALLFTPWAMGLPENSQIITGYVTLTINGVVVREFPIPPQRPYLPVITSRISDGKPSTFDAGQGGWGSAPTPISPE